MLQKVALDDGGDGDKKAKILFMSLPLLPRLLRCQSARRTLSKTKFAKFELRSSERA